MQPQEIYEQMTRSLIERYGELISRRDLAKLLDTSPESLGNILRRNNDLKTQLLRINKTRFGRRVFYPAAVVAAVFTFDEEELSEIIKVEGNGH